MTSSEPIRSRPVCQAHEYTENRDARAATPGVTERGVLYQSGTVLSFELGLLWPRFMEYAGPVIGMPFSLEGFAFFLEAIFLGIYL